MSEIPDELIVRKDKQMDDEGNLTHYVIKKVKCPFCGNIFSFLSYSDSCPNCGLQVNKFGERDTDA